MLSEKRQECQERQETNKDKGFNPDVSPEVFQEDREMSGRGMEEP